MAEYCQLFLTGLIQLVNLRDTDSKLNKYRK